MEELRSGPLAPPPRARIDARTTAWLIAQRERIAVISNSEGLSAEGLGMAIAELVLGSG